MIGVVCGGMISSAFAAKQQELICSQVVDPFEKFNRAVFEFNLTLDHTLIRPVTKLYTKTVPSWGRERVHSFVNNLSTPLTILNNGVQGKGVEAQKSFWRFFVNTIFGIGGLFDVATKFGLHNNAQTFDDSFAHYGVNYGAYLNLPFLGPTTLRGASGKLLDFTLNPDNLVMDKNQRIAYFAVDSLDKRAEILDLSDSLEKSSLDYYAAVRSMYIQYIAKRNPACQNQAINYNLED